MASARDIDAIHIEEFKQHVFKRVAFLGMASGEAAQFVSLCVNLATIDPQDKSSPAETKRIARTLSRSLGRPRAELFMKWLRERIPDVHESVATSSDVQTTGASQCRPPCEHSTAVQDMSPLPDSPNQSPVSQMQCALGADTNQNSPLAEQQVIGNNCSYETAVLDEAWVEVKSRDGKIYYWNRASNSCCWSLPAGIRAKWLSYKSAEGRSYYCDRNGLSSWSLPPLRQSKAQQCAASTENLKHCAVGNQSETPVLSVSAAATHGKETNAEPDTPVIGSMLLQCMHKSSNRENDVNSSDKAEEVVPVTGIESQRARARSRSPRCDVQEKPGKPVAAPLGKYGELSNPEVGSSWHIRRASTGGA